MVVSKATGEASAEGVTYFTSAHPKHAKTRSFPWGYVEDACETSTQLPAIFNNRFSR